MTHTTLSRRPQADHVGTSTVDPRCCDAAERCVHCDEARAARRDAVIQSLALVRQRRRVR